MKLQCTIKRPGGTEVEIPNEDGTTARYRFLPIDPTRADSPHVADVLDEHVAALIKADASVYVPFKASAKAVETLLTNPAADGTPVTTATPAADAANAAGNGTDANKDSAKLPELTVDKLHDAIKAGELSEETLRAYLAQEEASDEPRSSFIAEIVKALK